MIKLENVSHSYGNKKVLNDINFTINSGEISCLVGVNGAGKTTLMNLIMKLIPIQMGRILIDDKPITFEDYNRISYVPDQIITLEKMTIQSSLDFMERYYTSYNAKRASELLDFFKLDRQTKIADLSKGNVAKVNLLLGLSLDSDYIIMDEPFSGIDALAREQIVQVFNNKLIENRAVLLSTHEMNDIEHLIDKVVMLKDGSIIEEFNPELKRLNEGKAIIDVMREVY